MVRQDADNGCMMFEGVAGTLAMALTKRLAAGTTGIIRSQRDHKALEQAIGAAWSSVVEEHRAALTRAEVDAEFFAHAGADEVARILLPGRGPSGDSLARAYVRAYGGDEHPRGTEPLRAPFEAFLEHLVEELGRHASFRSILAEVAATRAAYETERPDAPDHGKSAFVQDRPRTGMTDERRQLFVVMPFGTRTADHAPDRTLDFDALYWRTIRLAADDADWTAERIDDIVAPGLITDQYLRAIVSADLVLADISIRTATCITRSASGMPSALGAPC
jgi:hypothetical protein